MRRFVRLPLLLFLLVTPVLDARAQLTEIQPGARVRIQAPEIVAGRYTGTLLSRTRDTLTLGAPDRSPVNVPIDRITSAEVSRGSSRSLGARRGLAWGIPIGLVMGVLSDAANNGSDYACPSNAVCTLPRDDTKATTNLVIGGVTGALWGAGIGALIGRERWERFEVRPRSAFDVREGRARTLLAIRF